MKRLYLDTRDLIELLTNRGDVGLDRLATLLREQQWELVYSFANTCEVAIPDDVHETGRRFGILAELPHTFIRNLPPMRRLEFASAVAAYSQNAEPEAVDVFVAAWPQTFTYPNQDADLAAATRMSLREQVTGMAKLNPNLFRNKPEHMRSMQLAVDKDRTVTDAVRRSRIRSERAVQLALEDAALPVPPQGLSAFARWLRDNPARCPGWRIFEESYLEFCTNKHDQVDVGDLSDWSHVSAIAYVDAITLDRRIAGYVRAAAEKLETLNRDVRYSQRLYPSLKRWFDSL